MMYARFLWGYVVSAMFFLTCAKKRLEFCFETQLIIAFPWLVEGDHPHWGRISLGNFDKFYPVI